MTNNFSNILFPVLQTGNKMWEGEKLGYQH